MRFELTLKLGDKRYHYALELPPAAHQLRVMSESLSIEGGEVYTRQHAEVQVKRPVSANGNGQFSMDWHIVALTVIQDRGVSSLVDWLSTLLESHPAVYATVIEQLQKVMPDVKRCFARHGGQWVASSHNAEAVVNFSVDSTWVLARKSHLEPTQSRCVDNISLGEAGLIQTLMDGEIDAWL